MVSSALVSVTYTLVMLLVDHVVIEEGPVASVVVRPQPVQRTPCIVGTVVSPSTAQTCLVVRLQLLEDLGLLRLAVLDVLELVADNVEPVYLFEFLCDEPEDLPVA